MKFNRTLATIIAVAAIVVAVTSAVAYFINKISREKAYKKKWEDYIDCGLA